MSFHTHTQTHTALFLRMMMMFMDQTGVRMIKRKNIKARGGCSLLGLVLSLYLR